MKQTGLTLVELLISLAIATILMAIATPSFSNLIASSQVEQSASQMHAELMYARHEAILRQRTVAMCRSEDGLSCASSADFTATELKNWSNGWIAFVDNVYSTPTQVDVGDEIITYVKPFDNLILTTTARIRSFSATGTIAAGNFQMCREVDDEVKAEKVILVGNGRARIESVTNLTACS